jgi:hypothetical protein
MERRKFLQVMPLSALAMKEVMPGVAQVELPPEGHFIFLVSHDSYLDIDALTQMEGLLPKHATGGWIIPVHGNPHEAMAIYNLKKVDDAGL